ncbi:lytic polysaccharide monooxygenase auxiliary activity family 9 protein [Amycolatopsis vastitatis]|uniref:Chitin-binding protein n=1 Tax=Amycolatopsis vastitatis TaxID=1905142 RepID=A0A229TFR0_9PSEU|nr:lytic polysaccharide monooxygenase [Amycolatopsis vastitatis]OXM70008.1 chitin-binding protein [Amycolatopsis vastitatis]
MTRRRSTILAAVTVLLASLTAILLNTGTAEAHGAMMKPGSRTFLCWQDGLSSTGEIKPVNPACAAAVGVSGANSLYNWFAVLRSDGAGRTRGFIPDGKLCSGGNPNYAGFDGVGEWPLTHLTSGAQFDFSYNAWAAHPGWFYTYVTKDGWNPNQPLTWDELEDQPFLTVDHPPVTGQVGTVDGQYKWSGALPSNKTGRHIIYSVWKRSDSNETFYGCSDVTFDGGHGEVTGVKDPGTPPTSTTPTTTTGTPPPGSCMAMYEITNPWSGGYQATVTVMNHGTTPYTRWQVGWTLPAGQTIASVWNGTLSQSGSAVTVRNADWNGQVAADGQTTFGIVVNTTGGNAAPSPTCQGT